MSSNSPVHVLCLNVIYFGLYNFASWKKTVQYQYWKNITYAENAVAITNSNCNIIYDLLKSYTFVDYLIEAKMFV